MRIATAVLRKISESCEFPKNKQAITSGFLEQKDNDARSQRHRWTYKEHGHRLHEIAAHLGVHYATVSQQLKLTEERSGMRDCKC